MVAVGDIRNTQKILISYQMVVVPQLNITSQSFPYESGQYILIPQGTLTKFRIFIKEKYSQNFVSQKKIKFKVMLMRKSDTTKRTSVCGIIIISAQIRMLF